MKKNHRPYAFISYSHKDTPAVLPLIEGIRSRGFNVWYDAGIEAGTEWPEFIGEKLFECSSVLVFMTQNTADSANCRREIDFAVELEKKVLVIYLTGKEEMSLTPGLRLQINNKQAMFIQNSPTTEEFLNSLSVAEILKPCRITEEWDTLYPPEDEESVVPESVGAPVLKAPRQEPEAPADRSEEAQLLAQGLQLLEEQPEAAFEKFREAAQKGHPMAMYHLAECCRLGRGAEADPEMAYKWYRTAAEKGVTPAMLRQAKHYEQENGTEKGRKKAFLLLSIAAKLNNVEAMYELGACYMQGIGTEKDAPKGIAWLEGAANKEFVEAMYALGMYYRYDPEGADAQKALSWFDSGAYWRHPACLYELGRYFEEEKPEDAKRWYTLAAEHGHVDAISWLIRDGERSMCSKKELFRWYKMAAEHGDVPSMCALAECYAEGWGTEKDPREAAGWYETAAEGGDLEAMYRWAECLFTGSGVYWRKREAFSWYEKAAQCYGRIDAQLRLAECYRDGIGTHRDEKEAFNYCKKAADYPFYGSAQAKLALAEYYARGIGTERDPEQAFACVKAAAEGGCDEACLPLARRYDRGDGTDTDPGEAMRWYEKAAATGSVEAMVALADRLAERGPAVDAFAWYQRAAEHDRRAEFKLAVCYDRGFGTQQNTNRAIDLLYRRATYHKEPNAALYMARRCREQADLAEAARLYRIAAEGGSEEAYAVLCAERWYRVRLWNPLVWVAHGRALRQYRENAAHFEPIPLPRGLDNGEE